jgi:Zn-dependent protease with chaperone function
VVTANVARIGKTQKRKATVLELKDFQYPGERMGYLQALGGIWALFLILAGITAYEAFKPNVGQFLAGKHQVWIILLLYPAITTVALNYLSARPRKMELKKAGLRAKVAPTNQPQLHKLVKDASTLLCMKQPEFYLIDDDAPFLYAVPGKAGAVIMSNRCIEVLRPEELAAAVSKQLGHLKAGHVAVDLAITAVRSLNPLLQVIFLPATLMSLLMRNWQDTIEYTADRCSLLVTRRLQTCTAAMVKLAAAGAGITKDTTRQKRRGGKPDKQRSISAMTETEAADEAERALASINPDELDAYLAGGGELTDDPVQVERAFNISRFIEQQRNLKDRIRNLGEWAETDPCDAAVAKVDEIRAQLRSS